MNGISTRLSGRQPSPLLLFMVAGVFLAPARGTAQEGTPPPSEVGASNDDGAEQAPPAGGEEDAPDSEPSEVQTEKREVQTEKSEVQTGKSEDTSASEQSQNDDDGGPQTEKGPAADATEDIEDGERAENAKSDHAGPDSVDDVPARSGIDDYYQEVAPPGPASVDDNPDDAFGDDQGREPTTARPLSAPRSGPYFSMAAGAGACAAATCAPPICVGATGAAVVGMLFVLPTSLASVVLCGTPALSCTGLAGATCLGGPVGAAATTAAAAAVPYFEADEEEAAWDAVVGGLPGVLLGVAALATLPIGLGTAILLSSVSASAFSGGSPEVANLLGNALLIATLPIALLASAAMVGCAPLLALVGTSAARMQYAAGGEQPEVAMLPQGSNERLAMTY